MTIDDYKALLELQEKADQAAETARAASEPWRAAALQIALERSGQAISEDELIFRKDAVGYVLQGTGINAGTEWVETFPIALLFERLGILL